MDATDNAMTEIKFWEQIVGEFRRTVICPPELEPKITEWIHQRHMEDLISIRATDICPAGKVIIMRGWSPEVPGTDTGSHPQGPVNK